MMTVSIKFCGGARTVTGSVHLVSTNYSNVILDCGLFHGKRDDFYAINSNFSFDPQGLNACIISHAHIDIAAICLRLKTGIQGSVYSTPVTRDCAGICF
jgi:metallo-beta-lactamase family protein